MVLWQGGAPLTLTEVVVGSVLDDLEVRVLDEQGSLVAIDPQHVKPKAVNPSWVSKNKTPFPK